MARNKKWITQLINDLPARENGVALDIGAYHGEYTKLLATKFSTVVAFEPYPKNAIRILNNVPNKNVRVEQKAIGTSNGLISLFLSNSDGGSTTMVGLTEHSRWGHSIDNQILVESVKLDTFCKDKDIKFIICDIEGGEHEIFYHGKEMLRQNSPTIVVETHRVSDDESDQLRRNNLFVYFKELGYKIFDTDHNEILTFSSFTFGNDYLIQK